MGVSQRFRGVKTEKHIKTDHLVSFQVALLFRSQIRKIITASEMVHHCSGQLPLRLGSVLGRKKIDNRHDVFLCTPMVQQRKLRKSWTFELIFWAIPRLMHTVSTNYLRYIFKSHSCKTFWANILLFVP